MVPTNFGGNSFGPIIGPYLFLAKFVWTNGPESSSKVSPYIGIGPWMALPNIEITQSAPEERRRRRAGVLGSPFLLCPLEAQRVSLTI